ncbi:alpha/beta fold hydrolase [Micromonospora sp. M12]
MDTTSAARDLDAVRAALGERQLTFHGSSYGTLLGQRYAELYPGRVRAMVLEAVMDHSLGTRASSTPRPSPRRARSTSSWPGVPARPTASCTVTTSGRSGPGCTRAPSVAR